MSDSRPAARRQRLADRAEVAAAGLHRVAAAAEQRCALGAARRVGIGPPRGRSPARAASIRPKKYCAAVWPRLRIRGSSFSARSAISRKQRSSSAAAVTGSLTGAGVVAAAKRAAAISTLSMAALVNGKGGRAVDRNG